MEISGFHRKKKKKLLFTIQHVISFNENTAAKCKHLSFAFYFSHVGSADHL